MVSAPSHRVSRVPWYSGYCRAPPDFGYGALTLFGRLFQSRSPVLCSPFFAVRTPECTHSGLGSSAFARRYLRNRCFFLFLRVLRCFSSPGSPPHAMDSRTDGWGFPSRVSPFRYLRLNGYLLLPGAFRSLSRLSSALSAKASALRPSSLDLFLFRLPLKRRPPPVLPSVGDIRPHGFPCFFCLSTCFWEN